MSGWVPMASIVTVQPSSASVASSSGMAVFSLDFWEVALCPRISPESAAKALTRCNRAVFSCRSGDWSCRLQPLAGEKGPVGSPQPTAEGLLELLWIDQAE